MKKLLFIHHSGSMGGAGISLIHILDSIDKSEYDIKVICPNVPSDMNDLLLKLGYTVVALQEKIPTFLHYNGGNFLPFGRTAVMNYIDIIKAKKYFTKIIKASNCDIVIVNSMTLFWLGKVIKNLRKQAICFHRESYAKGIFGLRTFYIKKCLSNYFDKVTFISNYDYIKTGEIKSIKRVIYDRVDINKYISVDKLEARKDVGFNKDIRYILYVGGVSKLKGAHIILKSLKYIDRIDIRLVMVCSLTHRNNKMLKDCKNNKERLRYILGLDYEAKIIRIINKYNLNDRVIFVPKLYEIEKYFVASDVVVFPSTRPHQARPVYEAGVAKVPILITDYENTKEFIENGITGFEFKERDCRGLAKMIISVLENKYIDIVIKNNYNNSITRHSLDTLKNDINELFLA